LRTEFKNKKQKSQPPDGDGEPDDNSGTPVIANPSGPLAQLNLNGSLTVDETVNPDGERGEGQS
jgi:hypothetical protein